MDQPYPAGAQTGESQPPAAPPSITTAVRVMYAGAAASILGIVIDVLTISATRSAIEKRSPHLSASQVNASQHSLVAGFIVGGVVAAVLWIVLAQMCRRGKGWARMVGTVLFVIASLDTIAAPLTPEGLPVKLWTLVVWLIGLAAVLLLWRPSSTDFFGGMTS